MKGCHGSDPLNIFDRSGIGPISLLLEVLLAIVSIGERVQHEVRVLRFERKQVRTKVFIL